MQAQPISPEALAECRLELTAMLGGHTGAVPLELLVEHLITHHGHAGWPVLREAGRALLCRIAAGEAEAPKPEHGAVLGVYRTRRARAPERPYATMLVSLAPLTVACDCADYLLGGLGLCKHGSTVLDALYRAPRRLARAQSAGRLSLALSWEPVAALAVGDRLAGIYPARARRGSRGRCKSTACSSPTAGRSP